MQVIWVHRGVAPKSEVKYLCTGWVSEKPIEMINTENTFNNMTSIIVGGATTISNTGTLRIYNDSGNAVDGTHR